MTTNDESQVWLSRKEVAARLGVTVATVYRWDKEGRLPAFKGPGGQYRYRASDIDSVVHKIDPKIPKERYAEMIEAMLGPAEAEGAFTYAPDDEEWQ